MTIELKKHQLEAIDLLLTKGRVIFADKTGLGKTFPTLAAAFTVPGPRLIVVPSHLLYTWLEQIDILFEGRGDPPYIVYTSPSMSYEERTYVISTGLYDADALLISYPYLRIYNEELQQVKWGVIVYDEAHMLRGRGGKKRDKDTERTIYYERSQVGEAARRLKYRFLFLLTATPQKRDVGDWFSLLSLVNPQRFTSYWQFVTQYARLIHTPWGDRIGPVKDKPTFKALISPYLLRRTYAEAGIDLKDPVYYTILVEPTKEFLEEYRRVKKTFRSVNADGSIHYLLTAGALQSELYKLVSTNPDKFKTLLALLEEHSEEQVIIWTWRRSTAVLLANNTQRETKALCYYIHGGQTQEERKEIVAQFKASKKGRLFATIASLSLGMNLQTCAICIFYEESYLPGDNEQAIGRIHRLGQEHPMFIYYLHVKHTIDQVVHLVQSKRQEDAESILLKEVYKDDDVS